MNGWLSIFIQHSKFKPGNCLFVFCPAKFLSPSNAEHLDIYSSETFVREQEGICNKLPMNLKDIKMPVVC